MWRAGLEFSPFPIHAGLKVHSSPKPCRNNVVYMAPNCGQFKSAHRIPLRTFHEQQWLDARRLGWAGEAARDGPRRTL